MTIPTWVLLLFALWTLITLFGSVGVYRWSRILTGRVSIGAWRADEPQGDDWYRRAMRAHANCLENLPVYCAIVVSAVTTGANGPMLDYAAIVLLVCRVCQTVTHIAFSSSNASASVRFAFFAAQAVCMITMGVTIAMAELQ
jgi:uncharacterized MAPEG superfamily protein